MNLIIPWWWLGNQIMGRLAGFRYREIVKILQSFGLVFDRQAAGSHEIWYNPETNRYTTISQSYAILSNLNS